MKINLDDRIAESLADSRSFDEKLAEAKASGNLFQIVITPNGRAICYQTQEEKEFYESEVVKESARPAPRNLFSEIDDLKARISVLEKRP